jgi:acetyl esterase/lipase
VLVVGGVEVTRDLVYYAGSEAAPPGGLLDVYAPVGMEGGPVVVIFHGCCGHGKGTHSEWGLALAEQGAVVFVPNWQTAHELPADPYEARDLLLTWHDALAPCAVSYALAHAAEYGADPETLVLVGHSAGASAAAVAALREPAPRPECAAEMTPFVADGMVLFEGDWLLVTEMWTGYGENLPMLNEALNPWADLATGPKMPVTMVCSSECRASWRVDSAFWVRDPTGRFQEALEAAGALADGRISVGDMADLLAAAMREEGFDVAELLLEHSGHALHTQTPEDLELLYAEIMSIPDR